MLVYTCVQVRSQLILESWTCISVIICIKVGMLHTRRSKPARHMLSIPHNYKQHKSFTALSNSFFYSAPRLCNSLPETRRFASSLGSCLFEDISLDKVVSAIAFYYINIPAWLMTYFPTTYYCFDYPNDLCMQKAIFLTQIRRYRCTID